MMFMAAAVFGWVSYAQLPLNLMPDLSYPSLTVRTEYSGAAPEEVEARVSKPVEEALSTTDGLVAIESRSRAEQSDVVLEFNWGTDMSAASQGVRERLQTTWLGEEIERPLILHYNPSLDPILRIALAKQAEPGREDAALFELRQLAEDEIKRELEGIEGVAAVGVRGGLEREVRVELREDWMAARGVTLDQVRTTLLQENVNIAGGSIREGDTEFLIRTLNEFTRIEDVQQVEIQRGDGVRVALTEVAVVTETSKERSALSRLDGREAVELEIFKEADANVVAVAQAVKDALGSQDGPAIDRSEMPPEALMFLGPPTLAERLPDGVEFAVLDDQARFIEDAINNLRGTALLGGVLAVLVLFLFLRDLRATAIIATAIPISVICTFAALYMGDVSLNLMSLGGLALGVGMLVDNSVVVLEAISVHLESGKSRQQAAIAGAKEVAAAVTASTLTTVAVFLPIVFVQGVAGQIFGDLALAVVFSLLASLVVALVLVPMLAAREFQIQLGERQLKALTETRALGAWDQLKEGLAWNRERGVRWLLLPYQLLRFCMRLPVEAAAVLGLRLFALVLRAGFWVGGKVLPLLYRLALGIADGFGRQYERVADRYVPALNGALNKPGTVLGVSAMALILALVGLKAVGSELIPEVHQGRFTVKLSMPVGTPLDRTVLEVGAAEAILAAHPDVDTVYAAVGSDGDSDASTESGEHSAKVLVQLSPGGDLSRRQSAAIRDVRAQLRELEKLDVQVEPSSLFSVKTPVEVVITGPDLRVLGDLSDQVAARMAELDGVRDVHSSLVPGYPEIRVRYDRDALERYGLTTSVVANALRDKVQGTSASRLSQGDQSVDLVVQLAPQDRSTLDDLQRINVNPQLDPPIPLSSVAVLEHAEGPSEIRRIGQRRGAVVSANLDGLDLASTSTTLQYKLAGIDLPNNYAFDLAGQTQEMDRSLRSLAMALLLAVFLVYVIMASTFESLVHPFVILFSVPLAAVGVIPALMVTGSAMSVVVFIGLIVLAGMVVNNAIVLVDRINQLRAEGMDRRDAIVEAGRARLRPILITTFTTALGLLPLSLGLGAGSEIQQPLALTVIAGLLSSTLLTLVVVPVVYRSFTSALERFQEPAA
jgi:HAE1 family hydrophobic/amphiphilic exporter-1